jgi:hypothetical protein
MQAEGENASQQQDDTSTVDKESVRSNRFPSRVGWSGLMLEQQSLYNNEAQDRLKNCITLDNGSTLSLFSNPELVQDIQTTETTLSLTTNAGVKQSNQEAFVPGFGKVLSFYDKDATIANIFGFSDLKQKHRITYDSEKEDAFLVHMENEKVLKFECSPEGLVSKDYKDDLKKPEVGTSNLISTVTENRRGYTGRQFERAKIARALYQIVGRTIKFQSLVPMNTKQHEEYYRALDQILRHYNNAGFVITTIHCDG